MLTQPQPSQQSMSGLLSQVATVVSVEAGLLGMNRKDKRAGTLAERDHNAKGGIATVNVSRLAGHEDRIKEIRQQVTKAREAVFDNTTAWGERRLLANVNIERMLRAWHEPKNKFDELVHKLVDDAPRLIAEAEQNKGTFDVDVPTIEEIESAFSLEFKMEAIPDASKWKASNLDQQIEAELRRRFEADIGAAYQQAQQDALTRLAEPLRALVERMDAFQKREDDKAAGRDPGKGGYFKDTLIDNVQQIADVFGSFNLTGDPAIEALSKQLQIFKDVDAETLRNHKAVREATQKRAQEILTSLGDWLQK